MEKKESVTNKKKKENKRNMDNKWNFVIVLIFVSAAAFFVGKKFEMYRKIDERTPDTVDNDKMEERKTRGTTAVKQLFEKPKRSPRVGELAGKPSGNLILLDGKKTEEVTSVPVVAIVSSKKSLEGTNDLSLMGMHYFGGDTARRFINYNDTGRVSTPSVPVQGVPHVEKVFDNHTRGQPEKPRQLGHISSAFGQTMPLFGFATYPGSTQWHYFTSKDNSNFYIRFPIKSENRDCVNTHCKELYDGDTVDVEGTQYTVSIY